MSTAVPTPVDDTAIREWLDRDPSEGVHGVCPTCSPLDQPTMVTLCGVEVPAGPGVDRDIDCAACIVRTSRHYHGRYVW